MEMVHNRLPVSDTKIYSIARHPSPCRTNAHIYMYAILIMNRLSRYTTPNTTHSHTLLFLTNLHILASAVFSDTSHHHHHTKMWKMWK